MNATRFGTSAAIALLEAEEIRSNRYQASFLGHRSADGAAFRHRRAPNAGIWSALSTGVRLPAR